MVGNSSTLLVPGEGTKLKDLERTRVASESAVLVGVQLSDRPFAADPLEELRGLAETAGAQVVGELTQRREQPDGATYLGKGKVEELRDLAEAASADIVLFDNDLSPGQTRSLEQAIGIKVLDRTELILDIFASHAQTFESRLAVELAQLEYSLPRLKRMWTHLSRLKMGIGMRGPGEKQLEVDRRLVEKRIADLRAELKKVERRREQEVSARRNHMTVSLIGYTNAGKSTLMNRLTGAGVYSADQLFATLDTRTRRWQLPHWGPVLLSDTVGFIRDLPHHLIASFRATLEEARQADLLLHVADASNATVLTQVSAVFRVLKELGIEEKDTLLILNKVDAPGAEPLAESVRQRYPNAISVSARTGEGMDFFAHAVSDSLSRSFKDVDVNMSVAAGRWMAYLAEYGEILSRTYGDDDRVTLHCRIPQRYLGGIRDADIHITLRESHETPGPVTPPIPTPATFLPEKGSVDDVA